MRNINNPELILIAWDRVIHLYKEFEENGLENFLFFPIDLISGYNRINKSFQLIEVLGKYDLTTFEEFKLTMKWAKEWPTINQSNSYLRKEYLLNNKDIMRSEEPIIMDSLIKRESAWRPFFEGLGYKNLLWWS